MEAQATARLPEKWANPSMIRWARDRMGLKPSEVEELSKIPATYISKWEEALDSPSLDELETLADIYDCPVGYFFMESPPSAEFPLDFRGLASEKAEKLDYETHLNLNKFIYLTDFLASLSQKTRDERKVHINTVNLTESIKTIAQRERKRFGLTPEVRKKMSSPDDAFDFLREAIEDCGVFVISLKLNPNEVRGASRWAQQNTAAILVNRNDMEAATGRCFTLLHEWAHLLIEKPGIVCDFRGRESNARIERFSNSFAAELLVPREEFEEVLRQENLFRKRPKWGDATINRIRRHFLVSKDVIAVRLEDSNLAPNGFYASKRAAWDRLKPFYRRNTSIERRHPTKVESRLVELGLSTAKYISRAYEMNAVSKLELAEFLDMKVEKAEGFISWVKSIPQR